MIHEYQHNEVRKRWLFLIALLINAAMLLFIFILEMDTDFFKFSPAQKEHHEAPVVFDDMPAPQPEPEVEDQVQTDEVAALKQRASIFGATDTVQEEAEFMPGTTDSETLFEDGDGPQAAEALEETAVEEQILKQESHLLDELPHHEAIASEEEANQKEDTEELAGLEQAQKEAVEKLEKGLTALQAKLEVAKRKAEEQRTVSVPAAKKKKATKHNTGRGTKAASPIEKGLTFADLATGFLENLKNEGEDWLSRDGNPNIRPQQQELKYLSYYQKLGWHLQNVCRYHKFDFNPAKNPGNLETHLSLTINKQGMMTDVRIARSSGLDEFDYFALKIFQSPYEYPPIPQHIPEESITIPFLLGCRAERQRIRFSFQ